MQNEDARQLGGANLRIVLMLAIRNSLPVRPLRKLWRLFDGIDWTNRKSRDRLTSLA
jgi:hypothetical protein